MNHTPGPWIFDEATGDVGTEDGVLIHGNPPDDDDRDEELAANAHLIAAAPELLAACEAVLDGVSLDVYRIAAADMGRMEPAEHAFDLLRAAIAKASPQAP